MARSARWSSRARGGVAVTFAVVLPVLIGLTALAVDVGYLFASKAQLENASAAAALACESGMATDAATAVSRAKLYGQNNSVMGVPVIIQNADVQFGNWNVATRIFTPQSGTVQPDACRVTANVAAPTFFASIFGVASVNETARAVATFGTASKSWNLVIVQDVTASFKNQVSHAIAADQALLGCVKTHTGTGTHVGLTEFTGVSKTMVAPQDMTSTGYNTISTAINGIKACDSRGAPPCSGTNTEAAIVGGMQQLDTMTCTTGQGCAMIVVTDGEPNEQTTPGGTPQSRAVAAAKAACAKGYSIFAIYYSSNQGSGGAANVRALVCGKGTFFQTPVPADLAKGMFSVCATLPPHLVYQE